MNFNESVLFYDKNSKNILSPIIKFNKNLPLSDRIEEKKRAK